MAGSHYTLPLHLLQQVGPWLRLLETDKRVARHQFVDLLRGKHGGCGSRLMTCKTSSHTCNTRSAGRTYYPNRGGCNPRFCSLTTVSCNITRTVHRLTQSFYLTRDSGATTDRPHLVLPLCWPYTASSCLRPECALYSRTLAAPQNTWATPCYSPTVATL
jgi:hypothetical protein